MTGDFFLTEWFFLGMRWLCENVLSNNIFLTILISTLILRLIMLYPDIKQRQSTAKMQAIQPRIQQLQERYKNDPRKVQLEQTKLMKENGVSMFGGCLPMLLTIPLLFCFIAAFRFWGYEQNVKMLLEMDHNITTAQETDATPEISETFLNSKFLWINNIWQPDNGFSPVVMPAEEFFNIPNIERLVYFRDNPEAFEKYKELGFYSDDYNSMSEEEKTAFNEARIAKYNELTAPLTNTYAGYNNGMFILPILATGLQFLYAWYIQRKQTKAQQAAGNSPQQGAAMGKVMTYLMPIMSFFFCLSATSAFAVYWTLSSLFMLAINLILQKTINPDVSLNPGKAS